MSRNVFQKSSDDGAPQIERVEFNADGSGGELPYLKLLTKILDKVSPFNTNKEDKTPHIRVALNSLGLMLTKDKASFERMCAFLAVNASAHIDDSELTLTDAPEGFIEMREKIKDALLEEAKQKAEGNLSNESNS